LAFDRQRKRVTALVNGRGTDHNCAAWLKHMAGARVKRFHPDKWESHLKLLSEKNHLVGKEGTRHIERHNLNFRTHVKRLQRRTICFSRARKCTMLSSSYMSSIQIMHSIMFETRPMPFQETRVKTILRVFIGKIKQ
jgi:insertion element IS1 protein InsB